MAYNNHAFLLALILLAATTPQSSAQILPALTGGMSVSGGLCCTSTGGCPGAAVSGAVISLNCSSPLSMGASVVLGQNTTDINGGYNITVPNNVLNVLGLQTCNVVVLLPIDQTACRVLSTANGALIATVQSVGTMLTQAFGLVQNGKVSAFLRFSN